MQTKTTKYIDYDQLLSALKYKNWSIIFCYLIFHKKVEAQLYSLFGLYMHNFRICSSNSSKASCQQGAAAPIYLMPFEAFCFTEAAHDQPDQVPSRLLFISLKASKYLVCS